MDWDELRIVSLVAGGGAAGSVLRYLFSAAFSKGEFPWDTALVNILGSFALALLFFLALSQGSLDPAWRAFLFVGVLGGFTTMSTFTLETLTMMVDGAWASAAGNVVLNVLLCLVGAFLGRAAGLVLGGG